MSTIQKVLVIAAFTGLATALLLPGRQTVPVIGATKSLIQGGEHTVITGQD